MPPFEDRLALARQTMVALVDSAELPPKLGVHPRQPASLTSAMPALLRGSDSAGATDLLGIKWVTVFPGNGALGLPQIHATVVLNDPITGIPIAILDGGAITAQRTAAVSGVALQEWWPKLDRPAAVTVVGAGVQGASHVGVLVHVAPGALLTIADRQADRAEDLAAHAGDTGVFGEVISTTEVAEAVGDADVVLTMISFGSKRQTVPCVGFQPRNADRLSRLRHVRAGRSRGDVAHLSN